MTAESEWPAVVADFRGNTGHDIGRLRERYRDAGGAGFSREVLAALSVAGEWGTDLRYEPGARYDGDAAEFFRAVRAIDVWARRRVE